MVEGSVRAHAGLSRHVGRGRAWLLALGLVVAGAACSEPRQEAAAAPAAAPAPAPARPAPQAYPQERCADPETFSQPRLQFTWQAPGDAERGIFSMRLDGSDLRRVVSAEHLARAGVRVITDTPVRSPDRRYVAGVGYDAQEDQLRFLVDLETGAVRTMMPKTYGQAFINWTPDSRSVLFYGDLELWQYDVRTGQRTKLPMIYSRGLHLVDGGKRFLAVQKDHLGLFDRRGKRLRRTPLPFELTNEYALSPDGELLLYRESWEKAFVVRTRAPGERLAEVAQDMGAVVFGPDARALYYFGDEGLASWELSQRRRTPLAPLPAGSIPGGLTLLGAGGPRR